ncbi:Beclin 1-associated autophagy-related key regulator [Exaiptasia diaphana]|nr:Beclin 1-associated autophagy-related key regulator [Exaiptasia diaphana]
MCVSRGDFSKSKQSEISYCELQRKYENLKRLKLAFQTRILEMLEKRKHLHALSEKIVIKRERVHCLHQVLHDTQESCNIDLLQLNSLRDSNSQKQKQMAINREKVTRKAHAKDQYKAKLSEDRESLVMVSNKLSKLRKRTVINTQQYLFPVEAIPVYPVMGTPPPHNLNIDLDTSQDIEVDEIQTHESVESALAEATQTSYVEGRWVSKEDDLNIEYSIVDSMCVLRGNNDYSSYCDWVKAHRNGSRGPDEDFGLRNPAFTICAGLSHTAQFLELLAYYFDVILPKKLNYSEFCHNELSKSEFRSAVSRLNSNILHLCFTQHVDPTLLSWDRPLHNLYALLNSSSIGRIGAFECHPEQLLLSVEQDKSQSDDSDMEDGGANSESDTDWETLPKSLDVPEDVPIYTNTSTKTSMTLSSGQEESTEGPGTTASLVTSAAASVAALWPWKR